MFGHILGRRLGVCVCVFARPFLDTCRLSRSSSSEEGTMRFSFQRFPSKGINSMKRTSTGLSIASFAKSPSSSSLCPLEKEDGCRWEMEEWQVWRACGIGQMGKCGRWGRMERERWRERGGEREVEREVEREPERESLKERA